MPITHTLVIPVYRNEAFLPEVLEAVRGIARDTAGTTEVVFVVDGSPDGSEAWLLAHLREFALPSQLITLSRNFGSFTAVRTGLAAARGEYIAVMAADLQEPPSLVTDFYKALAAGHDVAVGTRAGRDDSFAEQAPSRMFWGVYRKLVNPEMPAGGVDMFAVTRRARDALLALDEAHSSLVAQLYWIGFSRVEVPYHRLARKHGKSGWTLRKKITYLLDSIFSFTDIPITLVTMIGFAGTLIFLAVGMALMVARFSGVIQVPGYTAIMVTILFAASLILFGLGVVGNYVWRTYENTKRRPLGVVRLRQAFGPDADGRGE